MAWCMTDSITGPTAIDSMVPNLLGVVYLADQDTRSYGKGIRPANWEEIWHGDDKFKLPGGVDK